MRGPDWADGEGAGETGGHGAAASADGEVSRARGDGVIAGVQPLDIQFSVSVQESATGNTALQSVAVPSCGYACCHMGDHNSLRREACGEGHTQHTPCVGHMTY